MNDNLRRLENERLAKYLRGRSIPEDKLIACLDEAQNTGAWLVDVLHKTGTLTYWGGRLDQSIDEAYKKYSTLVSLDVHPNTIALLPRSLAEKYCCLVVDSTFESLGYLDVVSGFSEMNLLIADHLAKYKVRFFWDDPDEITTAIAYYYGKTDAAPPNSSE